MTGDDGTVSAAGHTRPSSAAGTWLRRIGQRVRERDFWVVQGLVVAVTVVHIVVEATDVQHRVSLGGLAQLPVVLHIIPVVYAGFRYGYEGSVLTGLWSGVLAIPNIVFWHSDSYGWLADLTFIGFVIVLGVVIAVPVERERRQRQRAQAAGRRLETLNRITAELSAMTDLERSLTSALDHLVQDLPICSARLLDATAHDPGGHGDTIAVAGPHPTRPHQPAPAPAELAGDARWVVVPLDEELDSGALLVELDDEQASLNDEDRELLETAARQIGSALEASRLRRREQDRLRTYAREVTRAQERERSRIARDLHDVVAQDLTILARKLDELDDGRGDANPAQARELADDILDTVRHVSRGLRPPALEDLGLLPALRSLATDLDQRTSIETTVHVEGNPHRLPHEIELTLYRIAQEALHNAERHGDPDRVTITVTFTNDHAQVSINDDGRGFDADDPPEGTETGGGLGLLGMRERAALAGGTLHITSDPGAGTTVTARIPA